eukprot:266168_1
MMIQTCPFNAWVIPSSSKLEFTAPSKVIPFSNISSNTSIVVQPAAFARKMPKQHQNSPARVKLARLSQATNRQQMTLEISRTAMRTYCMISAQKTMPGDTSARMALAAAEVDRPAQTLYFTLNHDRRALLTAQIPEPIEKILAVRDRTT